LAGVKLGDRAGHKSYPCRYFQKCG